MDPNKPVTLVDILAAAQQKGADNIKFNGSLYSIQNGQAKEVLDPSTGQPFREAVTPDTSPTTIHVPGKGTFEYRPEANGWGLIQGTEETPDAPKVATTQLADGRVGVIKFDGNGNPFIQAAGGDNPTTVSTAGTVVSPGQAVKQPDGTYTVPVPAAPSKSADDIHAESVASVAQSGAATNASNVAAANVITPQQRIKEIHEAAQAQAGAAIAAAQAKVDSGIEMTEKDRLELQNQLAGILAETQSSLRSAEADAAFQRDQPGKDRAAGQADRTLDISQQNTDIAGRNADTSAAQVGISQQNANTNAAQVENNRINNEQTQKFQRDQGQATVLTSQAAQGQQMLDRVVKAGVAPSMGSLRAAINPLQMAFQIMQGQVKDGSLSPNNLPTPMAPRPAGSGMSVPSPAPSDPNQAQY
jgi:hypothetical protein